MPLVNCPACKKQISDQAPSCPSCGQPMQTKILCPNCKSDKVQRISGASKVGSALMFGVFAAGSIAKTYQCLKCRYKW